ncbi:MAG: ATP-binding protein [Cyclobacteriaceae bacterium]
MQHYLGWIFGVVISQVVWGAIPSDPEPFVIEQFQPYIESNQLQHNLWIAADTTDIWSIEDASALSIQQQYESYEDNQRKHGALQPQLSYWGKIRIKNGLSRDTEWLLELSNKNSFVDVYIRQADSTFTVQHTGYYLPVPERAIKANVGNSVWLSLQAGQEKEIYIKIKRITGFRPRFGLLLLAPQHLIHQDITFNDFTTGVIEGALCIMALFFLFYYVTSKDKTYFYYTLFLLSTALYYLFDYEQFYVDAFLGEYIYLKLYLWLLASVFFVFLILFARSFLKIPERFPVLDWIFKLMIGIRLFLLIVCLGILLYNYNLDLVDRIYATSLNDAEVLLWIGVIMYLVYQRPAKADRYMLIGVSLFIGCVGMVLLTFQIPGLHQRWIPYIYNIGLTSQVLCFSVALGIRQRISQKEALELKTRMNEQLEEKVKVRTRQIDEQHQLLRTQATELQNLNHFRSRLLANISHEFRTPLTLIINPLEKLLQSDEPKDAYKKNALFRRMKFQAQSLLQFVDQLLMLSRIETATFDLQRESVNIIDHLHPVLISFYELAERQQIHYEIHLPPQSVIVHADIQKITMVVNNLLSNAFKFTGKDGKIAISLQVQQTTLLLIVQDDGIGIDPQEHSSIFDRFYQSEVGQQHNVTGTGIGLSLTQEIVKLHDGTIELASQLGEGATFTVSLPIVQEVETTVSAPLIGSHTVRQVSDEEDPPTTSLQAPKVLIVEDNAHMQQHLRDCLQDRYQLFLASHGKEGQAIAEKQLPDLVVTDLAMPQQDGIQLTQALKGNVLTSHIPIIMLTAWADQEHQARGWQHGADAYITKPFDVSLLKIRIQNLLDERARLRDHYLRQLNEKTESKPRSTENGAEKRKNIKPDPFLEKLIAAVEAHYTDNNFDVESLSEEMCLSSSQLNRKLKALIHQSSNDFIRSYRLRKAAEMLLSSGDTVAEIAYTVGFSNPSYFTRRFREHYGHLPSQHQKHASASHNAR